MAGVPQSLTWIEGCSNAAKAVFGVAPISVEPPQSWPRCDVAVSGVDEKRVDTQLV